VGRGRLDRLRHVAGGVLGRELQLSQSLAHPQTSHLVGDESSLPRSAANVLGASHDLHQRTRLPRSVFPPAWPRKWRVGANSPSLWPTMFSLMKTGTCFRPSWTATVWPTISGKMVESRAQVRTTFLSRPALSLAIFCWRLGSMYGPFLSERDILSSLPPRAGGAPKGRTGGQPHHLCLLRAPD